MPSITDAVQSATNAAAAASSAALTGVSGSVQAAQAALAPNVWVGAADNKLATADPYNPPNGPSVITDVQNLFQKFDFTITDVLRGGKYVAAQALGIARDVKMLTSGDITARILGASLLTKTLLNGLGAAGLGNIVDSVNSGISMAEGAIGDAVGTVAGEVYADLNGVVQQISSAAAEGLAAVGACINTLGVNGSFSIADSGAKIGLYAGLIQTSCGYGMQGTFGSLMATVTDRNILGAVTMRVIPSIVNGSDVKSLLQIGLTLGSRQAYAYSPNLLSNFSAQYTTPLGTSSSGNVDYASQFQDTMDAYNAIDSDWSTLNRQTTITDENGNDVTQNDPAFNLNAISNGSTDFQKMVQQGAMASTDPSDKLMLLANQVQQTTVASKLAAQFPQTVFNGNSQISSDTQDPQVIAMGTTTPTAPSGYSNIAPNTNKPNYDIQPDGIHDIKDAKLENGIYVWPDGYFQVGATHQGADGEGYVSKGITFN
ncbi:hypothetical protein [Burkholderia phage FLC9]|nr:hypothetical protein [Burkholderia phage FLC9]